MNVKELELNLKNFISKAKHTDEKYVIGFTVSGAKIMLEELKHILERSDSSGYASAVKNLIDCNVDYVETTNGKYVEYEGVIDCLNLALEDFA